MDASAERVAWGSDCGIAKLQGWQQLPRVSAQGLKRAELSELFIEIRQLGEEAGILSSLVPFITSCLEVGSAVPLVDQCNR